MYFSCDLLREPNLGMHVERMVAYDCIPSRECPAQFFIEEDSGWSARQIHTMNSAPGHERPFYDAEATTALPSKATCAVHEPMSAKSQ